MKIIALERSGFSGYIKKYKNRIKYNKRLLTLKYTSVIPRIVLVSDQNRI